MSDGGEPNPFTIAEPSWPPTPSAPPAPEPPADERAAGNAVPAEGSKKPPRAFLGGLAFAWKSWRVLLFVVAVQIAFGLSIAAPLRARFATYLDHHPHAPALAGQPDAYDVAARFGEGLDWSLLSDIRRREASFLDGISLALVWVAVLAWLFGQAAAGGFLSTAAEDAAGTEPMSVPGAGPKGRVARFLAGGGRWFFPMVRISLVFLVLVEGLARRLIFEAWGGVAADGEARAVSQEASWHGPRVREAVFVALFLFVRAGTDLGRAHLVVKGRRSAVIAFFRGCFTLIRHPLRAGGLALLVGVPEMALLAVCAWLVARFPGGTWLHLSGAFLALQLAVFVRWSARAAVLAANVRLLRG